MTTTTTTTTTNDKEEHEQQTHYIDSFLFHPIIEMILLSIDILCTTTTVLLPIYTVSAYIL